MVKIYLDTCVWCRPFDKPSPRITKEAEAFFKILGGVDEKRFTIVGSIALDDEIQEIQEEWKREEVIKLIELTVSERVDIIFESKQRKIKRTTGLTDEDAFHLMFAIGGKAEYFISVDDDIINKADKIELYGIKVRNPVKFLMEAK